MTSAVPVGTAVRIAARTLLKVLRAGSGTPARYSSTSLGAPLPFAAERSLSDFTFFMRAMLQELQRQVHAPNPDNPDSEACVRLRLAFLLFFGLFDGLAKFLNSGHVRRMQRIPCHIAPSRSPIQRTVYMAFIDHEHVLGRPHFCLRMRTRILRCGLRGVWRPAFLPTKSDATVGRLHNHRTIVGRQAANRRLNYFPRTLANGDHQIRRLRVHHRSEPAPTS